MEEKVEIKLKINRKTEKVKTNRKTEIALQRKINIFGHVSTCLQQKSRKNRIYHELKTQESIF